MFVGNNAIRDVASAKQDPGWGWSLLNSGVDIEMISVESRSLSMPSILLIGFLLVDARSFNYSRLPSVVRRLILRLVRGLCNFLQFVLTSERKFVFLHAHVSSLWECLARQEILTTVSVSVMQTGLKSEIWAVHNCACSVEVTSLGVSRTGMARNFV